MQNLGNFAQEVLTEEANGGDKQQHGNTDKPLRDAEANRRSRSADF